MHSLFLRFFMAFLLAITLVVIGTGSATIWIASAQRASEREEQEQLAREASDVLNAQGETGLVTWLDRETSELKNNRRGYQLYVLDSRARDLLHRPVPGYLRAALGRSPFPERRSGGTGGTPDARLLSRLLSPENQEYYLSYFRPFSPFPWGIFSSSLWPPLASVAIVMIVGAIVSWLLARFLIAPIQHLRAATHRIASGDLRARVAGRLGTRGDELAMLAVDFDAMSNRLSSLLEARQQLLRDVSHELRSPLARLQLALGLAQRPGADLEQELSRIEREAQRLDELIGEILSLCRLDDPARPIEPEPLQLDELLEQVVESSAIEAEVRGVRINLSREDAAGVQGDRELLYRAVENVVRNAIRFSPERGIVEIAAHAAGGRAQIVVDDRGPGVPAEVLGRIFEPFFRVGSARDRDSGGNGIGLAITRRVMHLHGGSVQAENRAGGGLRVVLELPLDATLGAASEPVASAATQPA